MSSHTQHLVAVATPEANTILFQVNDKFELCLYESSTPVENDEQPYDFRTIKVNGAPVKVNNGIPVIAAVAFSVASYCGGEAQVRVYFVDRDNDYLRELQRSGGKSKPWTVGRTFNLRNYRIAKGSGLTANVFQQDSKDKFAIKIYYQESSDDIYADVVYNIVGSDNWTTRPNVTQA